MDAEESRRRIMRLEHQVERLRHEMKQLVRDVVWLKAELLRVQIRERQRHDRFP